VNSEARCPEMNVGGCKLMQFQGAEGGSRVLAIMKEDLHTLRLRG